VIHVALRAGQNNARSVGRKKSWEVGARPTAETLSSGRFQPVQHRDIANQMKVTRFTQTNRCPICGGWEKARRGHGERCFGFLSDDRRFAHCTREEHAGGLPLGSESNAYCHVLAGDCRCGVRHDARSPSVPNRVGRASRSRARREEARRIVGTYDYRQPDGTLLFQVVRRDPKGFSQRRPDGAGGWVWNLQGINPVLYRLPELLSGNPKESVFVVEGEKDADKLASLGFVSTTNPMGAGKWRPEYADALRGRDVVLLPDNDRQGHEHMESVALSLLGVASSIKLVNLPDLATKGDVSDWLAAGGTVDGLNQLVAQAQEYKQRTQLVISAGSDSDKGAVQPEVMPFHHHHLTDLGNAQRFVERHGRDLRFSHERNKWFVWGGTRWAVDMDGQVERRAKDTTISIYDEAASEEDADRRARLGKWAAASESRGRISAMIELAKTEPGIPISTASFDADPFLLNCLNGTINLQTGQLQEHRREDFCTKLVRVHYEPTATCPLFEAVLDRIMGGNTQLTSFMQRAVGYFLTGSTKRCKRQDNVDRDGSVALG
jgi:putative DNA primase/helicase